MSDDDDKDKARAPRHTDRMNGSTLTFLGLWRTQTGHRDSRLYLATPHALGNLMETSDPRTAAKFLNRQALRDWFAALPADSRRVCRERGYRLCDLFLATSAGLLAEPAVFEDPGPAGVLAS